jgi:glycosyltransferase involved in cell wall biosynthesis
VKLSVIIPTYNRSIIVDKTSYGTLLPDRHEIFLVSDGSSEARAAVVETLRGRMSVRFVTHAKATLSKSRNTGSN